MFGAISDIHLDISNKNEVVNAVRHFIGVCSERNISRVFCLGDIFLVRKSQTTSNLEILDNILDMFVEAGITLDVFAGNHDKVNQEVDYSYISPFREKKGINIHESVANVELDGMNIIMIPFYLKHVYEQKLEEAKDLIDKNLINVCLTHIDIDVPSSQSMRSDDFKDFDITLSGHHHDAREVSLDPYVRYIGSLIQSGFSENNDKGGIIVHDDGQIERVPVPFREYVSIVGILGVSDLEGVYESAKSSIGKENVADVRIKLIGDRNDYLENRDLVRNLESLGVQVLLETGDDAVYSKANVEIFIPKSLEREFVDFAESVGEKDRDEAREIYVNYTNLD